MIFSTFRVFRANSTIKKKKSIFCLYPPVPSSLLYLIPAPQAPLFCFLGPYIYLPILDISCKGNHNVQPFVSGCFHLACSRFLCGSMCQYWLISMQSIVSITPYLAICHVRAISLFPPLTIMNNAVTNICVQISCRVLFSFFLDICQRVERWVRWLPVSLTFWGTFQRSCTVSYTYLVYGRTHTHLLLN